jgi:hypothetical protein
VVNTKAIAAWNAGATGAGVRVGVVDSGIDFAEADLQGRISGDSTDVVPGRDTAQGTDDHGTLVSGIIAANFNDQGTIGVAYQATIVSIRADVADCDDEDDDVCFRSSDLVRAIDYAISHDVRVINMSLGGEDPLGFAFESALQRAVDAGVVLTIAAGNEAGASPEWPGRYASDPRFAGSIIVVGAHDSNEALASFSNRAGVSARAYLTAPGDRVLTGCDAGSCWRISGTSFSAPAVAGALALLLDAFPNLTGAEAVEILLTTARDAGEVGIDAVFGRGLLDIAQAFQPIGSTSVETVGGQSVSITRERFSYSGRAFGDALRRTARLRTVGRDAYRRLFNVDLAGSYGPAPRLGAALLPEGPRQQARVVTPGPLASTLSLTYGEAADDTGHDLASATNVLTPWLNDRRREDMLVEVSAGRGAVAYWQGRDGARSPFDLGAGDTFASLAQVDRAWMGAVRLGALTLTADTGVGDRAMPFQSRAEDVSTYARFVADWNAAAGTRLRFAVGGLDERMGPLGGYAPLDSGLALPSSTTFGSVAGRFVLAETLVLDAEMGFARTDLAGQFLELSDNAVSSTWRLGLTAACEVMGFGCQSLTWSIQQPLRTESGMFSAWLPDTPDAYFDPTTFSERRFSAAPSGRQIDVSLGSLHRLRDGSYLSLRGMVTRDDQNIAATPTVVTVSGSWRTAF